jgi:hypothetical protein
VPDLDINFQFVANAQSLQAETRKINAIGEDFARLIVDEVAIAASSRILQKAKRAFISDVKAAIHAEVARMASYIGRFITLPDKYTGPHGEMSLGGKSSTAALFGFEETFDRKSTNVDWAARTKRYLEWKQKQGLPAKWWAAGYKGKKVSRGGMQLQQWLMQKDAGFYEQVFGPIRVTFEAAKGPRDHGRFTTARATTPGLNPTSGLLRAAGDTSITGKAGVVNVTSSGRRGKVSADYRVGTLRVDVFGKITPAMLPGLAAMDPTKADAFPTQGVVGLFPNDGKKGQRVKLLGTRAGPHYRYAIEPFVSFFLTRAIPNAVWRRTENLIRAD